MQSMWIATLVWAMVAWVTFGAVGWVVAICHKNNDNWPENICMFPVCLLFGPITLVLMKWRP